MKTHLEETKPVVITSFFKKLFWLLPVWSSSIEQLHVLRLFLLGYLTDRLDIRAARVLLDNDHYAMEKLKKRVLEYLAVRQLKNNLKGPILCFVGPPGVGKTSVGRSVAKTLGREFHRIALGGVCDQSDIRGHRQRTSLTLISDSPPFSRAPS